MDGSTYQQIIDECIEFGWLNQYQDEEFRQLERATLLPALEEIQAAHQVLAAIFLGADYLEPGVRLAPSKVPWPAHEATAGLPERVIAALETAHTSRGNLVLGVSGRESDRRGISAALLAEAKDRGFSVARAVGRVLEDGKKDQVLERLLTELLESLAPDVRADYCIHEGQYLQLLTPLEHYPVRPGGVFNTDPGLNRNKLNKAFSDLLIRASTQNPICLVIEEAQHLPWLALDALAYLAWIVKSGTMGLSGLDATDRTLDRQPLMILMTTEPMTAPHLVRWVELLKGRRVQVVELDTAGASS